MSSRDSTPRKTSWAESGPRWFGVKCWKGWFVAGSLAYIEESIYLVRAADESEAQLEGRRAAERDAVGYRNEEDEPVEIRVRSVAGAYDLKTTRLKRGVEVFAQLFEVGADGNIDWDWNAAAVGDALGPADPPATK